MENSLHLKLFPWNPDEADPRFRLDLGPVVGFAVGAPSYLVSAAIPPYPTVELSTEFSAVLVELRQELERELAVRDFGTIRVESNSAPYFPIIGMAGAQGGALTPVWELLQLAPSVNAALQNLAGYIEIGRLILDLSRWWVRRAFGGGVYNAQVDRPYLTAEAIRLICSADVADRHGDLVAGFPKGYVREGPKGSVDHPTGNEIYTVVVNGADTAYIYLIDGRLVVYDHFKINGDGVNGLPLPDWLEDAAAQNRQREARDL